jgi:type IV secretory pathway VirB2 component (pilin)
MSALPPSGGEPKIAVLPAQEFKPWQVLVQWILNQVPPPLGPSLVVVAVVLGGAAVLIGRAYTDFDLRLILEFWWFLLAICGACILWLFAAIAARKRLGWGRVSGFCALFLAGAATSGWGAWHRAQYEYNDALGFFEQKQWHRARLQGAAQQGNFEWRIDGALRSIPTLSFQMPRDPKCRFIDFQPPPPQVVNSAHEDRAKVGWNACLYDSGDSQELIVENFGRGGSIVFTLEPESATLDPENCALPTVRSTKEHC